MIKYAILKLVTGEEIFAQIEEFEATKQSMTDSSGAQILRAEEMLYDARKLAMENFEAIIEAHGDSPVGYHGWAEAALFEMQANGNFDEKGKERINEGQVAAYFQKAAKMDPESTEYQAALANALIEFDRIPKAIRELKKLKELGDSSDDFDVTADLFQAAKMLIDNIDFKTNFDRSEAFAKQFIPVAVEFAFLGMGFSSTEEAVEYLALEL